MRQLVHYSLTIVALILSACSQPARNQTGRAELNEREKFYGAVWVHPGKKFLVSLKSGTLYLKDDNIGVNPADALSSFSLQRLYGGPFNKRRGSQEKAYYITHRP